MSRRLAIRVDMDTGDTRSHALAYAQTADAAGVEVVFTPEAWGRDAFSILTQIAERTSRIRVGTGIVNIFSRTPAALAQHFATLNELSGGRVVAGLGTSGALVIEQFHGIPYRKPATRLRETIQIMRMLFAQEPLRFDGEVFKLERGFTFRFEPPRYPIPIYLASFRPAGVRLVAELADGWLPMMIPADRLVEQVAGLRATIGAAGRDPASVTVHSPGNVVVTRDVEAAHRAHRRHLAYYVSRMGTYYRAQLAAMGRGEEADTIARAWDEGGSAAGVAAVSDDLADALAIITTPDTLDDGLARLRLQESAGVDLHAVSIKGIEDPTEQRRILEYLREK